MTGKARCAFHEVEDASSEFDPISDFGKGHAMPARRTRLLVWIAGLATIATSAGVSHGAEPHPGCIADSLPELRQLEKVPAECNESPEDCLESCSARRPEYCLSAAYAYEARADPKAGSLFERACRFGLANACTNYGAQLWANETADETLTCALRVFRASCSSGEHFACGMVGRMAFERAKSAEEYARVRRDLESSCSRIGGFPCRVLAMQLETGKLGPVEPGEVRQLLARGCDTGDPDACGNPKTADETFDERSAPAAE